MSMGQMGVVLGMLAPWSPAFLQANGAQLQLGGVLEKTQNGVRIFLETKRQPPNVEALDTIQKQIVKSGGLQAEIQSANPEGDKVRGRIQIRSGA